MRTLALTVIAALALAACAPAASPEPSPTAMSPVASAAVPADPNDALVVAIQGGDANALADALANGADPNLDMGAGVVALMAAVQRDDASMVQSLLDAGAAIDDVGASGYTALHRAGELASADVVATLLAAGANTELYTTDAYAFAPIHVAAFHDNTDAIQAFVDGGVPIDQRNERFEATALHFASFHNQAAAVELLLILGADPSLVEYAGYNALDLARQNNSAEAIALLELVTG